MSNDETETATPLTRGQAERVGAIAEDPAIIAERLFNSTPDEDPPTRIEIELAIALFNVAARELAAVLEAQP